MSVSTSRPPSLPLRSYVAWPVAEAIAAGVLSLVSSFVVARMVGPAEVGIAAAVVSVHVLLWVAVNALFADALVQHAEVDDAVLSSAFWSAVVVGLAAMVVQGGSGWGLAWLLDDVRLVPMAWALAVPLPLVGAGGVMQGLMTRQRAYRRVAMRTLVGHGFGTVCGIGGALSGMGAWAMVSQQWVTSFVGALVLLAGAGWRPSLIWHRAAVRSLLAVGLPLTANTLVLIARYRLFVLVIGGTAGAAALGQVHMAFRLVDTVRELTFTALWRLFLPDLSRYQDSPPAMLARVDRLLAASCLVTLPICGALAVTLVPFVGLALGPQWQPAGEAAIPLAGLMAVLALTFPSGVALVAAGQTRRMLYGSLAGLGLALCGVLLVRPEQADEAVLVWCASQIGVLPYVLWVNARSLGVRPLRPLREALPMSVATAIAVAAAMAVPGSVPAAAASPVALMAWRAAVGSAVIGAAFLLLASVTARPSAR